METPKTERMNFVENTTDLKPKRHVMCFGTFFTQIEATKICLLRNFSHKLWTWFYIFNDRTPHAWPGANKVFFLLLVCGIKNLFFFLF
jgi:hypothetical protein